MRWLLIVAVMLTIQGCGTIKGLGNDLIDGSDSTRAAIAEYGNQM